MTPERWQRVEEIFEAALERPAAERRPFVATACGDDSGLRADVERLLETDHEGEDFFEQVVVQGIDLVAAGAGEEARVGSYRLLRRIGYGGMAEVFLAERADRAYDQRVAVKLMRPGLDSGRILERFRRERQILASLEHPNIARLLDGGTAADGRPYLVMEYIDGLPIDRDCDRRRLGIGARLELFRTVCAAVDFAHRHLVVHRDLKPSNILITRDGTVKLLDFGIAKLLSQQPTAGGVELTLTADRPMTPSYASPEQVRGERITVASDVYSLGVVLYELLTGRRPFDLGALAPQEAVRRICDQAPPAPSAIVVEGPETSIDAGGEEAAPDPEAVGRARGVRPEKLRRLLRGDLDTIVLTALRKERSRRYGSAERLSRDVGRHLAGRPIEARPDHFGYRTVKFLRRNRLALVVAAAFLGVVAASWVSRSRQAARILEERDKAQRVAAFLVDIFDVSDPGRSRGATITARELLDEGATRLDQELGDQPLVRAMLSNTVGRVYRKLGLHDEARPHLEEALEIRRRELGAADPEVAESLHSLGLLLRAEGDSANAEKNYRQALAMVLDRGSERRRVAELKNDLALVVQSQARFEEAEALFEESLALYRALHGEEHPSVATALNNLAMLLEESGDYERGERLMAQALEVSREVYHESHPVVLQQLNNLAIQLVRRGDFAGAEPLYQEALALRREVLGAQHPDFLESQSNMASLLFQQGDYPGAEALFRESLELARARLGDEHPEIAPSLNNLAAVRVKQGDYAGAEALLRESLALQRRHLGDEHPAVATGLDNLAAVLFTAGDAAAAEPLYEEALALRRRRLEADHPEIARSLSKLALLYWARDDYAQAMRLRSDALAIQRAKLGEEHPTVARTLAATAAIHAALGEAADAEALYRRAADQQRRLLPAGHPDLAASLTGLGEVLTGSGEVGEAEDVLREALAIRRDALPAGHWRIAETESALGACLLARGRVDEAGPLLVDGHRVLEEKRGADHRLTRRARERLAGLGSV